MDGMQEQYRAGMGNRAAEENEIDLMELARVYLAKWYWILLAAVVLGAAAFGYFKFFVDPTYESKTQIYVVGQSQSGGSVTYADLQLGSQLGKDYVVLVKSRSVIERVISEMGLNTTYKKFLGRLEVSVVSDSRMMSISYTDKDPQRAKQVADKIREVVCERIQEVMKVESVQVVDDANLPQEPVGPRKLRNSVLAALVGAILVMGILTVQFLLDDRIKTAEDVEKYLGLSVLGSIPLNSAVKKDKRGKAFRKTKK